MLTDFLISLGERTPMLLLALTAMVIAVVRWRRHPGVSGLTALASLLYIFKSFAFAFLFQWLPRLRESMQLSWERYDTLFILLGVFNDFFFAVVLLMLVLAAFSNRAEAAPSS
jgi:hypothetical protein